MAGFIGQDSHFDAESPRHPVPGLPCSGKSKLFRDALCASICLAAFVHFLGC